MNLEVANVGKINYANIELDGITVIAGENNTGKSTIGKMLFCIFHSFCRIEEQIIEEQTKTIARVLRSYYHEVSERHVMRFNMQDIAGRIVSQKEAFLSDKNLLIKELEGYYLSINFDAKIHININQDSLERLAERICSYLNVDDGNMKEVILRKRLEAEFAMKVGHVNDVEGKATINLNIKSGSINFEIVKNDDICINNYMSLNKEIVYIDDPFVLDELNDFGWSVSFDEFSHRFDILKKLAWGKKTTEFTLVDELVVEKRMKKIFAVMGDVCDGSLLKDESGNFVYQTDQLKGSLDMINLSTGMKSFVIIRRLLETGNIDENGVLILDEPEIHLHPEWQLKFAEIIVLIQKEFGVNILLNTHSPYFLNAIEVYSQRYGIDQKCKYYLANEDDGRTEIINVTNETDTIYAKLAKPLQELENLEYRNESTV